MAGRHKAERTSVFSTSTLSRKRTGSGARSSGGSRAQRSPEGVAVPSPLLSQSESAPTAATSGSSSAVQAQPPAKPSPAKAEAAAKTSPTAAAKAGSTTSSKADTTPATRGSKTSTPRPSKTARQLRTKPEPAEHGLLAARGTGAPETASPLRRRRGLKVGIVAAPLAVAATVGSVSVGMVANNGGVAASLAGERTSKSSSQTPGEEASASPQERDKPASRSGQRQSSPAFSDKDLKKLAKPLANKVEADEQAEQEATDQAVQAADTKLWTTEDLNLWADPAKSAQQVGEIDSGEEVLVTGRTEAGRQEIVVDGQSRWVTNGYLDEDEPTPGLGGACTNGTTVSGGVSPNIAAIHQAVCSNFPSITTYGTLRGGGGDHGVGRAVDIMVSGSTGWEVAEFVRAHAAEFNVNYVIYAQKIWSVQRSGEGWRAMSDRGSVTANHYDHVHVSVY